MKTQKMSADELDFIQDAVLFLEGDHFLVSIAQKLGKPIDRLQEKLPESARRILHQAIETSLKKALRISIETIKAPPVHVPTPEWENARSRIKQHAWLHTAAVTTTGAISGALGISALLVELPISTSIILRSISSVAQEWGHDLRDPETQLQCLFIFSLGSNLSSKDDEMDTSYLASRLAYQRLLGEAAAFLGQHGAKDLLLALDRGAPVLLRLLGVLGPAFERTMIKKFMSKALPIIGAAGGAAINAAFCHYFTEAARYHFGLLYLEKKYGSDAVRRGYSRTIETQLERQKQEPKPEQGSGHSDLKTS